MRTALLPIYMFAIVWGPVCNAKDHITIHTQRAACTALKKTVAALDNLPVSGPPNMGWFCDFADSTDPDLFVVALRSNRRCPEICSNLMGWYAVRKSTGQVLSYDINDETVAPLRAKPDTP